MSGKRYQSGYDDGFEAGNWAGQRDVLSLMRELAKWLRAYAPGLCEGLLAKVDAYLSQAKGQEGAEESGGMCSHGTPIGDLCDDCEIFKSGGKNWASPREGKP